MTKTERLRLVNLLVRDTTRYQRKITTAAARVGFRTMRKTLAAWRTSRDIAKSAILSEMPQLISSEFMKSKDELRDAMLLSHLAGIRRSQLSATLSLSAAGKDIKRLSGILQISKEELEKQKEIYDDLSKKILVSESSSIQNKIQKALDEIEERGSHLKEGRRLLIDAFDRAGITPNNSFQIETIYRTHTQMAYSAGRWQTNNSEAISEILWGYEYAIVDDFRVRPAHAALDGTKLQKDNQFWLTSFPPNGWNCRCQAVELFEEEAVIKPPTSVEVDGKIIIPGPDEGFNFNPGIMIRRAA